MGVYELLKEAIRRRQAVFGVYEGLARQFCPHILGFKAREPRCLGYQFGGETSSGPLQTGTAGNWRCFKVARLSAVRLIESEGWHTGPAHSQTQRCIDIIDVDVERPELDGRSPPD